jgi:fermentation-respiration switch protein FrsA (DUF1100 family)
MRRLLPLIPLLFLLGCLSLEPFYYQNAPVDEYFKPEDMEKNEHYRGIIPAELVVADSFETEVGDTCFAFWALLPGDTTETPDTNAVTILYHHGNLASINDYWDRVELLWELGYRVYIYDYPGFGRSTGSPSTRSCYASAEEAFAQIRYHELVDSAHLVFYGYSLGGYMACHLSVEVWTPAALVLESAVASTGALLKDSGLLGLSGGIVSDDDYSNEELIAHVGCPLLMMHGCNDDYITFENNALVLWELAVEPKDSFWVEGACHGDIPYVAGEAYTEKLTGFLNQYLELDE